MNEQSILAGLERFGISLHQHSQKSLHDHLRGTAAILRRWGCSEELCRTGLCHSIYGTESYSPRPATLENRDYVRGLIGEEAERLAYLFGAHKKESLWANLDRKADYTITDCLTESETAINDAELRSLITLTLANWLEQRPRASTEHQLLRKDEFTRAKALLPEVAYEEFQRAYGLI